MAYSADDYLAALQGLLPPGRGLTKRPDANLTRLLHAFADGFARIDVFVDLLFNELDPRTTLQLLPQWEFIDGLPDPCCAAPVTIAGRQAALVAREVGSGGDSIPGLEALALTLGFTVTITEPMPFTCNSNCNDPLQNDAWAFALEINAPTTTVTYFTCQSSCSDPLEAWGNDSLQCALQRAIGADVISIFIYG